MKYRNIALCCTLVFACISLRPAENPSTQHSSMQTEALSHEDGPQAALQLHGGNPAQHAGDATGHGADHGADHGPEIKLFGNTLGPTGQFLVKFFNFGVFFLILFFLLKGALSAAFKARAEELADQLAQAEREKAEGDAQIHALNQRMESLAQELDASRKRAETDAEQEKNRILEAARQEAAQILERTRQDIETQRRLAERSLRHLVAELAVEGAAQRLQQQVQGPVAAGMIDRAISRIGSVNRIGGMK